MPPRRTHTKSRNGCAKCKKRRVKCDEVHPTCGNCIKHAIVCDFSSVDSASVSSPSVGSALVDSPSVHSPSVHSPSVHSPSVHSPSVHTPSVHSSASDTTFSPQVSTRESSTIGSSPSSTVSCDISPTLIHQSIEFLAKSAVVPNFFIQRQQQLILPPVGPFQWTMRDMELLHHYTIAGPGFGFLAINDALDKVWRISVPKLAFAEPGGCAMHSILAVSSLHLAYIEPENRPMRLAVASAHYDKAVRMISSMVPNICRDNCEAVFISSTLIVVVAIAFPLISGNLNVDGSWSLPEWLPLIRGVQSILCGVYEWVKSGCLSEILKFTFYNGPEKTDQALDTLYQLCTDTSEPDPEEIEDTEVSSAYFNAIHKLRRSFVSSEHIQDKSMAIAHIFFWPISVSAEYVALLKQRRPRALIIFAYYCVLLKKMEVFWWVRGRAEYELLRIERSIHDLEKWKKWLEWPIKMLRGEGMAGNIPVQVA